MQRFLLSLIIPVFQAVAYGDVPPEQARFFEENVRPLLVERCFRCHAEKKHEADLRLDTLGLALAGGESGPAIVPGKPAESLLIDAVRYRSLEMPPDRRLSSKEVDVLVQWVAMGAPWPGATDNEEILVPRSPGLEITDEDRNYWAFQSVRRPSVPDDDTTDWDNGSTVDAFVLKKLRTKGLRPSGPASRRMLIRRLYFDLIGLPPTYEEVEQFVADDSPDAFAELVDELLDRTQYGERWGRHWLDVVRFAQTNGYERDDEKPESWRYRDYVIRAFNDDRPFDQFIREQLAGDEIDKVTHDSIIATGYYRIGVWDDEPDDKTAAIFDGLGDIVRTTGEAFLGLTIGCARCHDHKFDPIPQADYYSLLAFVRGIAPYGKDKGHTHWELNPDNVFTPLVTQSGIQDWQKTKADLEQQIASLRKDSASSDEAKKTELDKQIAELDKKLKSGPSWARALSVREHGTQPPITRIHIRGNHLTKGEAVEPAFLTVTGASSPKIVPPEATSSTPFASLLRDQGVKPTSGRRRALAEWIASPENPLTARVIVNRLWHHHFGRGIVATPNDFGRTGQAPTHPELLDWLASELINHGWSLKHIHRTILLSKTWQQSSAITANNAAIALDPDNTLLWRQNLRRVESEVIRDSMLAVSGRLNLEAGGRGFFPALSAEVLSTQSRAGTGWGSSDEKQRSRRSVYIFSKRTLGVPMMEAFDTPVPDRPVPDRQTTTIAPQALILLNSRFVNDQAAALATLLLEKTDGSDAAIVQEAYRRALARDPSNNEQHVLAEFVQRHSEEQREDSRRIAVQQLARLVLNLNEFVYVD